VTSAPENLRLHSLVTVARAAAERAYAPYSRFRVGAAVMADDGAVFSGCNVENASYGLTICAERSAVFQMVAAGRTRVAAIAVYTPTPAPTSPCGACRQVLREFAADAQVIAVCDGPGVLQSTVDALLPSAFELTP
jgi:cytidine deaminase